MPHFDHTVLLIKHKDALFLVTNTRLSDIQLKQYFRRTTHSDRQNSVGAFYV